MRKGQERGRDNFIDYVRLGLALSVCLMHMGRYYHSWPANYEATWAVPAFLSISGYYVLQSYDRSSTWREFIKKRVLRIMPGFVLSLIIVGVAGGLIGVWRVLIDYLAVGLDRKDNLNNVVWSLSAEEIAYAALAVLFAFGAYRKVKPIWVAFAVSIVVATLIDMTRWGVPKKLIHLAPAFFAGSLIYLYRARLKGDDWRGLVLVLAAVLGAAFWHLDATPTPLAWAPGTLMGAGVLFLRAVKVPRIPDLSYGCYLYHMPLYYVLNTGAWVYFPALLALCAGSWFLVEQPFLRLKPVPSPSRGEPVPVGTAVLEPQES